jgi:hypothetical protein
MTQQQYAQQTYYIQFAVATSHAMHLHFYLKATFLDASFIPESSATIRLHITVNLGVSCG